MFININPELGKPQGTYFGISVTDGYNWHQCYSWAWEVANYWDNSKDGESVSVYETFPDIPACDEIGMMHQCIAICEGLTDRPKKRFFIKKSLVDGSMS